MLCLTAILAHFNSMLPLVRTIVREVGTACSQTQQNGWFSMLLLAETAAWCCTCNLGIFGLPCSFGLSLKTGQHKADPSQEQTEMMMHFHPSPSTRDKIKAEQTKTQQSQA